MHTQIDKNYASDANALRKQTGAGMMDCKKALVSPGDMSAADTKEKGSESSANRADRRHRRRYFSH